MLFALLACAPDDASKLDDTGADTAADTAPDPDDTGVDTDDTDSGADTDTAVDTDDTDTDDTDTDDTAVDTDTADTDTAVDTGPDEPAALLDDCVPRGTALREDWSVALPGVTGPPARVAWQDGTLAVLAGDDPRGADALHVFALPAPAAAATDLAPIWSASATDGLAGLAFPTDAVAVGDGATLRILDRSSGVTLTTVDVDDRIASLSADADGVFGGTAAGPFWWEAGALSDAAALGETGATAVARLDGAFWSASNDGTPHATFSDGTTATRTAIPTFGDPVDVVARPDGGAWVLGGPDSYAWIAAFDATGALLAYTQTFVGITQAVGSAGSWYAWSGFDGLGLIAWSDAAFYQVPVPGAEDLTALAIDPDGRWLLTTRPDGTLTRWSCVP